MEWARIRDHYAELFKALDKRQREVEALGGVPQNSISKLLRNRKKGPTVETFVNAVLGLGLPVATFFAQLEEPDPSVAAPARASARTAFDRAFERGVEAFARAFMESQLPRGRPRKKKARVLKPKL